MRTWLQYCAGILISNLFSGALSDFDNGVWIVHLDPECTHDEFHQHVRNVQVSKGIKAEALHSYYNVIHGVAVRDVHEDELRAIPCVKHFVKDSVKHLVGVPSWGQDRVDQENLPLDDSYVSYFSGQGVNVYILDTGIDTNHNEFNGGDFTREVKNIYSAFASKKKTHDPGSDTDGHGKLHTNYASLLLH
jgi:subtilisin family serine protease